MRNGASGRSRAVWSDRIAWARLLGSVDRRTLWRCSSCTALALAVSSSRFFAPLSGTRSETDAHEADQLANRARHRRDFIRDIELHDFVAVALTGVRHVDFDRGRFRCGSCPNSRIAVGEGRVGEPVAEGK